jgi:thiol-disulfide isomerase/thioredoxin
MSITELRSQTEIDNFIKQNPRSIIYFGTQNCGHCRNADPIYRSLVSKYPNVKFAHVEVSKVQTEPFRGYPAFAFYTNGNRQMLFGSARLEETLTSVFGGNVSKNPRILNSETVRANSPRRMSNSQIPKSPRLAVNKEVPNSSTRSPRQARVANQEVKPRTRETTITRVVRSPRQNNVRVNPRI